MSLPDTPSLSPLQPEPKLHRSFLKRERKDGLGALAASAPCPCRSEEPVPQTYGQCCGVWHEGMQATPKRFSPTPEALMRSRYSAYALRLADYLLATWFSESSPGEIDLQPTKWLGLEIKSSAASGDAGIVEFVARYRDSMGRAGRLHETSRFIREAVDQIGGDAAQWLYIDGQFAGEPDEAPQTSFQTSRHIAQEEASQELPAETKQFKR